MRTLKKTLCLVLALVMMLGVCAFGTSAAFSDADKITYKEAVDVLTGIGVIKGMGDAANTFNPNGTLTRAQACTIITKLMGADGISAKSTFTDMAGAAWAESYVAYCQAKGIVGGYGDGRFGPNDTLTGSQWGRMLLLAAGFDAKENGFESGNANWEIGVAKLVKDKKLAARISGFNGTQGISRDAACEMAFKAMQVGVSGEKVYTVSTLPNQVFDSWLEAYIASQNHPENISATTPSDSLMSQNFPKLAEDSTATDAAGRPASKWTLDGKTIALCPATAAYTATSYVKPADLNKALKAAKVKTAGGADYAYTSDDNPTANGVKIEWYTDGTIVTTDTELATIESVTNVAANRQHGAYVAYNYKIGTTNYTGRVYTSIVNEDTDLDTIIIEGSVAKKDTVLVVTSSDGGDNTSLPTLTVAPTVSGIVSSVRSTSVTIAGKSYALSGTAGGALAEDISGVVPNAEKAASFYVDEYGYLMAAVENAAASTVYTMILSVDQGAVLSGNKVLNTYTVTAADVDGKVTDYAISKEEYNTLYNAAPAVATVEDDVANENCYDFTVVSNNVSSAFAPKTDKQVGGKMVGTGTKFIYIDKNVKGEIVGTVTVLTSSAAKGFEANDAYVVTDLSGRVATTVFVTGTPNEVTTDTFVYYLGSYSRASTNTWNLDVILKGEETTITVKSASAPALAAGFYKSLSNTGVGVAVTDDDKSATPLENVVGFVYLNNAYQSGLKAAETAPIYVIDVTSGAAFAAAGANTTFGALANTAGIGDANDELYISKTPDGTVLAFYLLQNTDDVNG